MTIRSVALVLCFGSAGAIAAPSADDYRPLDFSVYFNHHKTDLDHGGQRFATTVERIGIAWRESFGRDVKIGLFGGYAFVTQTDNPLTAGTELDGYHAGIALDAKLWQTGPLDFFFAGDFTYQHVDHDDTNQSVDLTWREPSARLGFDARVGPRVTLTAGALYGYIEGQERASGTISRTLDVERSARTGGFVGIAFHTDPSGSISITAQSGIKRGGALYFARRF